MSAIMTEALRPDTASRHALIAKNIELVLGRRSVLSGINLTARPGRLIALIGPNAAGKSSLMKVLVGLWRPLAGSVELADRPIGDWDRQALARELAYLPQERLVNWPLAVSALVGLGRLPHRNRSAGAAPADAMAVTKALSVMDLTAQADLRATDLSGGEIARALLARALAQDARFLVADEPAAGLDPAHQLHLFRHLRGLAEAGGCVIVALHDLSLAARFCHEVVLMKAGAVIAAGEAATVLTAERIREAYDVEAYCGNIDGLPIVLPLEPAARS